MKRIFTRLTFLLFFLFALNVKAQPQLADSVISFSSQGGTLDFSAKQILDTPDVYPAYGNNAKAWTGATADGQREWIEIYFSSPTNAELITIYETFNPGAVDTVYVKNSLTNTWVPVYTATASAAPQVSRELFIQFPTTSFNVSDVRIALNSPAVPGFNAIDGVSMATGLAGIKEVQRSVGLSAKPNPAKDLMTVSFKGTGEKAEVTLYNILGEAIDSFNATSQNEIKINTSLYTNGIYMLNYKDNRASETKRIIINN